MATTFRRGKYRFRIADECVPAYRNALRILAEFGIGKSTVVTRLGEIKTQVNLGKSPAGAIAVEGQAGYYLLTLFTVRYVFKVDEGKMEVTIEDVDPSALTKVLDERARRLIAGG